MLPIMGTRIREPLDGYHRRGPYIKGRPTSSRVGGEPPHYDRGRNMGKKDTALQTLKPKARYADNYLWYMAEKFR